MPIYMSQAFRMSSPYLALDSISSFRMKTLVKRLQDYYGFRMRINKIDDYWIDFCVSDKTSSNTLVELQNMQRQIFEGMDNQYQAMCYLAPKNADQLGVFIHLYDPSQHGEFKTGFSYC